MWRRGGVRINGIFGLGRETHGELRVLTKGADDILTPDMNLTEWGGPLGEETVVDEDLKPGMRVRIVNEPCFGAIGTVQELIRRPQVIETEARVPTVRVLLTSGEAVVVPRANVELF